MKIIFLYIVLVCCTQWAQAQKVYTLNECIDLAIKNSQITRRAELVMQDAAIDVTQAKQMKIPTADIGVGHGLNFGRSIDPSTNDFINERITRGGLSGSAFLPLWQGNRINYSIKQVQYAEEASRWALKNEEENLRLQVTMAYLLVLNNKELAIRSLQQETTTGEQVKRLENLNRLGAIPPSQFYDLQGQYATDQMNTLDARQAVRNAKLSLSQWMNIPFDESIDIATDNTLQAITPVLKSTANFDNAFSQHSLIKSNEFLTRSAETALLAVKAQRYPRLGLGGDLGSNYSSAYQLQGQKVNYIKQLSNNFNYATYLSLNIPILDNYRVRGATHKAENAIKLAQVNTTLAKNTIQQRVQEALLLRQNAAERYTALQAQVAAFAESFRIAENRFNEGAIYSVEYLIAKNNHDRAQNQLISAKYEWAFRNKIVEFYESIK